METSSNFFVEIHDNGVDADGKQRYGSVAGVYPAFAKLWMQPQQPQPQDKRDDVETLVMTDMALHDGASRLTDDDMERLYELFPNVTKVTLSSTRNKKLMEGLVADDGWDLQSVRVCGGMEPRDNLFEALVVLRSVPQLMLPFQKNMGVALEDGHRAGHTFNIQALDVSGCDLTDDHVVHITAMFPRLHSLDVTFNDQLTPAMFNTLPSLRALRLTPTYYDDAWYSQVMPSLTFLEMVFYNDQQVRRVVDGCPRLEHLVALTAMDDEGRLSAYDVGTALGVGEQDESATASDSLRKYRERGVAV